MIWKTYILEKKKLGFEFDQSKTKTQPAQSVILNFSFILFTPTSYCFTRHRGLCIFLLLTMLGRLCVVLSTITSYLVSGSYGSQNHAQSRKHS